MFDISFSELVVIAVVALIVVGPRRLPAVARTLGHLFARIRRYIIEIKVDIAREVEMEELKQTRREIKTAVRSIEQAVAREVSATKTQLDEVATTASVTTPSADVAAHQARKKV